jgi:hypothetical protein
MELIGNDSRLGKKCFREASIASGKIHDDKLDIIRPRDMRELLKETLIAFAKSQLEDSSAANVSEHRRKFSCPSTALKEMFVDTENARPRRLKSFSELNFHLLVKNASHKGARTVMPVSDLR